MHVAGLVYLPYWVVVLQSDMHAAAAWADVLQSGIWPLPFTLTASCFLDIAVLTAIAGGPSAFFTHLKL